MGIINSSFRSNKLAWALFVALVLGLFSYVSLPRVASNALHSITQSPFTSAGEKLTASHEATPTTNTETKYAYVTLLAIDSTHQELDINKDNYFVGIRILAYQILHAKETRSQGIPFVVLAVHGTSEAKKDRLRRDGAIVMDIEPIALPAWVPGASNPAWANIFDKLRMWELTQYERLIFLDADVVLTRPLDAAFESATIQRTDASKVMDKPTRLEVALPEEYVFTAGIETTVDHHFPPTLEGGDFERGQYVNAGFFIIKPSQAVLDYYLAVLETPNSFSTEFAEQDLLNHVHRLDGPMPWEQLNPIWNIHRPMQSDLDAGVHSVHGKWWNTHHRDLLPYMASWRWRMQGYFDAMDEANGR